ncbi:hypothetical protein ABJI51_09960 [Amycolatopsis sp. NEAU-NG30]|uniref:Uncharacterized protein n=1 Tax=Amycolatopsis melonis TaxID=3156488 RepID=A0ABV0LAQ8_9PSEU
MISVRTPTRDFGGPTTSPRPGTFGSATQAIYDLMGKDAILFHHSINDDDTSTGSQYVDQAKTWFDSLWNSIATDYQR